MYATATESTLLIDTYPKQAPGTACTSTLAPLFGSVFIQRRAIQAACSFHDNNLRNIREIGSMKKFQRNTAHQRATQRQTRPAYSDCTSYRTRAPTTHRNLKPIQTQTPSQTHQSLHSTPHPCAPLIEAPAVIRSDRVSALLEELDGLFESGLSRCYANRGAVISY